MASGQHFPDSGIVIDASVDTGATEGQFFAFQVFTNAAIAAVTVSRGFSGVEKLIGVSLAPGIYQLRFTSIRFSSGIVMLFGEI